MRIAHRMFATMLALALGLIVIPVSFVAAQDASPEAESSLLAGLGLPVLEMIVTSDGIAMPAEIAAGPTLLIVHNLTEGYTVSSISQLPEGVTDDDYLMALGEDALPNWTADVVAIGGFDLDPMTTGVQVINLVAGVWSVGVSGEEPIAAPVSLLTVDGPAREGAADAIPFDLEVSLGAYVFDIPDTIAGGAQIWKLTNTHTVLHHLVLFRVDRLYTADEVVAGIMSDFSGTPAADGFSLMTAEFVSGSSAISGGQSIWIESNLESGFYVALCFLPDPGSDIPHAMAGMIDTFEVSGS